MKFFILFLVGIFLFVGNCKAEDDILEEQTVNIDLGSSRDASKTDDEVVKREEEAIKIDGLNVAQIKEMREKAEKFAFQAEVNRMMKLIINSLYKNKDIFLRELISNASDALDKIRVLSLTDPNILSATPEFSIKIKADKDNKVLHLIDTGIGMTRNDLVNNLGTIAKSGTAEFLSKMQEQQQGQQNMNDMIGQFGVGFYSSFLVADRVIVTSKHNDDKQYIWESDASNFQISEDPRGSSLLRGTQISLIMKDEAGDYLEVETLRKLIQKYSQFINFPIYLWASKTVTEEIPIDDGDETPVQEDKPKDEEADIEDDETKKEDDKPKTKKVDKTVWDWEKINDNKPIWTRKPSEIEDSEYNEFYKSLTKDLSPPLTKVHFVAEGEVTFKSLLFVPSTQPGDSFNRYASVTDNIKLYVRRVFITDEFADIVPNYLRFIQGIIDSDDLPLNVSRETLQQHKLLKVIKKKIVRKILDVIKKLDKTEAEKFWKEYSTNMKLGVIEDSANRSRLAKILRFQSSSSTDGQTITLSDYVSHMKPKQEHIYYIAGTSRKEVETSPFVERLLKKGYEVLYLVEAVDEYCLSSLPEFDGKKFQNVAKEGFSLEEDKSKLEAIQTKFEPLTKWLGENALKDKIAKAQVSERLTDSPCALVASMFGWTGNMERLSISNAHAKADDPQKSYYLNQRKTLEINPRHPLIIELQRRVEDNGEDVKAKEIALMMFRTATLRSGYMLQETADFAQSVENMMRQTLGIPLDLQVEDEPEEDIDDQTEEVGADEAEDKEHDEL
uniref:Uncharacterized protein n=1 Tax=Clastoptera arizonana TaxID=38151 RepID=A0A1B6C414_9HEMI